MSKRGRTIPRQFKRGDPKLFIRLSRKPHTITSQEREQILVNAHQLTYTHSWNPAKNHTGQLVSLHRKPTLATFTGIRKILSSSSKVRPLPSTNGPTKLIQNITPARNSDRKSAAQDLPLPNSKFQYYYSWADGEIPPRQDLRSNCDGTKKSNEHF